MQHAKNTGLTTIAPNHYNHCITLVTNYPECCIHCGSKQRLTSGINEYSTCKTCKVLKKLPPVLKRKRRKNYHYKHNEIVMFLWFLRVYVCTFRIYYKYTFFQHLLISESGSNVFKAECL